MYSIDERLFLYVPSAAVWLQHSGGYSTIQCNTTVLPSVNRNALGMFCGVTRHSKAATQRQSIRVRTGRNKQNMAGLRRKEKRKRKKKGGGGRGEELSQS